jgi:hypothetical protein
MTTLGNTASPSMQNKSKSVISRENRSKQESREQKEDD